MKIFTYSSFIELRGNTIALVCLFIGVLMGLFSVAHVDTPIVITDTSWRVITPEGNLEALPISNVGLDWEAANPDWYTNPDFDDFSPGWNNAIISEYTDPNVPSPIIWANGPLGSGSTPAYFRKTFNVTGTPSSQSL